MEPTVQVDTSRFEEVMRHLHDAMLGSGQDVANLLIDQHRLLTQTIVRYTPPLPANGAKRTGELAIEKDLKGLISEASTRLIDRVGSQHGLRDIDAYTVTADKGRLHLLWDNLDPNGSNLRDLHQRYRNPRTGRPWRGARSAKGEWRARVVVPYGARAAYITQVQTHVGRWKAKWAYGAAQLGAKFPVWISRHFGQSGAIFMRENSGDGTTITFGGRGPNFRKNMDSIRSAVRTRAKAMANKAKLIISGYAKDVAAGLHPKPHGYQYRDANEEFNENAD